MLKPIILLIFTVLLINSCDSQTKLQLTLPPAATVEDQRLINDVFLIFIEHCQPLMGEHLADIDKINIPYINQNELEISVLIKDKTTTIPYNYRAGGHTLHYIITGGDNAGITTYKEISKKLCSIDGASGENGFKNVKKLKNLLKNPV